MAGLRVTVLAAAGSVGLAGAALADGYPPFFGYSGYFGQPTPYYTHDPDVHQSTTMVDGYQGFGVRTYTTGGPFWGYKSTRTRRLAPGRPEPIRTKG